MPASRTFEQVADALNAAFMAHFELAAESRAIIAWDDDPFQTSGVESFVRFGLATSDGTLAAISGGSSQFVRRFGIVSAVVRVRHGKPAARRNALVEIVMDFIEQLNVAGMSISDPSANDLGVINGWQQVNCSAAAQYDIIRTP